MTRSAASASACGTDEFAESWVRVRSNLKQLLLGEAFEWIRKHELSQTRVTMMGGDLGGEPVELRGHDDHGRFAELFNSDGVVDTPRGARTSIAETDDADLDEARPFLDVVAGELGLGAGAVAGPEHVDGGAVALEQLGPHVDDGVIRPP